MKYFLKNITLFVGVPIVLFVFSLFALNYINDNSLKANTDAKVIFLGDSHIQCGLNPIKFEGASSIAENSEHYFFTYYKLTKYIELNPQINKVFVGFSYHNMSSYYDSHYNGEYAELSSSKSFFFLPRKYQVQFAQNTKNGISNYYKSIIKRSYSAYRGRLFGFDNHFKNSEANIKSIDKRIKGQFYDEHKLRDLSVTNLEYLGKIIGFCRSHDIQLTLITTPLHEYYEKNIPEKFKKSYSDFSDSTSVSIIDFKELTLKNDDFAPDGDHVSLKAVDAVSQIVNRYSL